MNITEDYVSYEVARLLKEKGFDERCRNSYNLEGKFYVHTQWHHPITTIGYVAPTHQMAMKWLREKYYIYADPIKQGNYNDCSEYYTWIVARMGIIHRNSSVADKLSYEEAAEAALKYSLENLI